MEEDFFESPLSHLGFFLLSMGDPLGNVGSPPFWNSGPFSPIVQFFCENNEPGFFAPLLFDGPVVFLRAAYVSVVTPFPSPHDFSLNFPFFP